MDKKVRYATSNLRNIKSKSKWSKILGKLNDYSIIPNKKLQEKMDFYITPYNTALVHKRHMEFEDKQNKVFYIYDFIYYCITLASFFTLI